MTLIHKKGGSVGFGYSEHNKMLQPVRKSFLYSHQRDAVDKMCDGCILNGGVGSGKSRAGIYYYFESYGGVIDDVP